MNKGHILSILQKVLNEEAQAIQKAALKLELLDESKIKDFFLGLSQRDGILFFTGVGKSGMIARKMASTFASLGLKSFFLNPVEALHGDLGPVNSKDNIILISKSGSTEEIRRLVPFLPMGPENRLGLLGNIDSALAKQCSIVLDCSVDKEACINNLAPTTSTTLTLALADALAVVYEDIVALTKEKFATNHPAGLLGKSLTLKVASIMLPLDEVACVKEEETLKNVLLKMTEKPTGICIIKDEQDLLKGIIVEGDIRRALNSNENALSEKIEVFMNKEPITCESDDLVSDVLITIESNKSLISILPVLTKDKKISGILRLQELLSAGFNIRSRK